jgi:hypothetical protein
MSEERPPRAGFDLNRTLVTLILLAIFIVIAGAGFALVSSIINTQQAVVNAPAAVATRIQEVIHPTPTIIASPVTIIKQVRSLARLETASFSIEKVITAEAGEGTFAFLFQDKLLLVAQGDVIAGVDLARLLDSAVVVDGTTVSIIIPSSEIFVATLNNEATFVYDRQTGLLGQQVDLETLARQQAEDSILSAAIEKGILNMAQENANAVIQHLLEAVGFENVIITVAPPTSDMNRGKAP